MSSRTSFHDILLADGGKRNLGDTEIQGVYVLDMIAHNNDNDRDVFQISPGTGRKAMWLAYQAHQATELWNRSVALWNQRSARRNCTRGRRSLDPAQVPHSRGRPAYPDAWQRACRERIFPLRSVPVSGSKSFSTARAAF